MTTSNSKKIAIVTGATGFLGSCLAKALNQNGWSVHLICRPSSVVSEPELLNSIIRHDYNGDIDELIGLLKTVASQSTHVQVFHLASLFLAAHKHSDVKRLIDSNVLFSSQLLEAMDAAGLKSIVNTGTSWQHFDSSTVNPVNLYAATKQAFEAILAYYVQARGFKAITLKLYDTYGSNDPRPKLIHLLDKISRSGEPLEMSPGEQLLDLVHVEDVMSAFLKADELLSEKCAPYSEDFFVTTGKPIALRDLATVFSEATGRTLNIKWGGRPYRDREVMKPFIGKTLPGWSSKISLLEGLRKTIGSN